MHPGRTVVLLAAATLVVPAGFGRAEEPVAAPTGPGDEVVAPLEDRPWWLESEAATVDAWLVLADQHADTIARRTRPGVESRVLEVIQPTLEALARIEPQLPPRSERRRLSVADQLAAENALLSGPEREARRRARDEVARLLAAWRADVSAAAWAACAPEQDAVTRHVEHLGGRVLARTSLLNALIVRLAPAALDDLVRAHDDIVRVAPSGRRSVSTDVSVPLVGADSWTDASVDGSAQRIAVLDTGIDDAHPAFEDADGDSRVVAGTVALSNGASESDFDDDETSADDLQGHGTHVAGIAASSDSTYGGVAPGALLLDAKCFYRDTSGGGQGLDADIVTAADWALTNGAAVLNLSFGDSGDTDGSNLLTVFFDAVADIGGVSIAVSAGNAGPGSGTVLVPGDAFNAVTAGALDDRGTATSSDDRLPGFTSRGPADDRRRKPDLVAPGTSVRSASTTWEGTSADFVTKSGTSMAAPHVAGALALLLDHEASWAPEALRALLLNSASNATPAPATPDDDWGAGSLDLAAAYTDRARVLTGSFSATGSDVVFLALESVAVGDRATAAWSRSAAYAATGRAVGGGSARTLVNLDLRLYDEGTGAEDTASASTVDPVEQVKATTARDDAVLKLDRSGAFPGGQTSVAWAVASSAAMRRVDPPLPTITLDVPDDVRGGATVRVTATISNDGDVRAHAPAATLVLPAGWVLAAGETSSGVVASLDAGASADATWDVVAPGTSGDAELAVDALTASYGETFRAVRASGTTTIDAVPPVARAGDDVSVFATDAAGRVVALDASASTDDSGLAVELAWDVDGDGAFDDATGSTPAVRFGIGTHDVDVRATDHVGNSATDRVRVVVRDNPPVAAAGDTLTLDEGGEAAFDGSGSTDVEGVLTYSWVFGDGASADGVSPQHVYRDNGTFDATLTVRDTAGQEATSIRRVVVRNVPPTAAISVVGVRAEGVPLVLTASATDPGPDDVIELSWEFADGTTATGARVDRTYRQDGVHAIRLTARDGDGGVDVVVLELAIANRPPVADAGPERRVDEGQIVRLEGSAFDPGSEDVVTLRWVLHDGTVLSGAAVEHAFGRDGRLPVTLVARDDAGAEGADVTYVVVRNVPPELDLPPEVTPELGTLFRLVLEPTDASASDQAALAVAWRVVDAAGAVIETGATREVSWRADAEFTGSLQVDVSDDDVRRTFETAFRTVAPHPSTLVPALFDLGLAPRVERRLLRALILRTAGLGDGAARRATRRAGRALRAASRGVEDALLMTGLAALSADLRRGRAPETRLWEGSADTGTLADALVALATSPPPGKVGRRVTAALLALHDAERRQRSDRRVARLRARALSRIDRLGDTPYAAWLRESITLSE